MRKSSRPESPRSSSGRGSSRTSKKEPLYLPEDEDEVRPRKKRKRDQKTISKQEAVDKLENLLEDAANEEEKDNPLKRSKFKKDFDKLKDMLNPDNPDFRVDAAANAVQRASLAMVVDLIPIAEATYRQTQKEFAAYALSSLIKQANELAAELRVNDDTEGKVSTVKSLIHSLFVRIAELLLREKFQFHKEIEEVTSDPLIRKELRQKMDLMIQSYGKGLSEYQALLTMQLSMFIQGDPNYLNPQGIQVEETENKPKKRKKK